MNQESIINEVTETNQTTCSSSHADPSPSMVCACVCKCKRSKCGLNSEVKKGDLGDEGDEQGEERG